MFGYSILSSYLAISGRFFRGDLGGSPPHFPTWNCFPHLIAFWGGRKGGHCLERTYFQPFSIIILIYALCIFLYILLWTLNYKRVCLHERLLSRKDQIKQMINFPRYQGKWYSFLTLSNTEYNNIIHYAENNLGFL